MAKGQTMCNSCEAKLSEDELVADGYGPDRILLCDTCKRKAGRQERCGWYPVMRWEDGWDGLRLASTAPVPWTSSNVVIISISKGGVIQTVHTTTGKRNLLAAAKPSDMILVAWPGARRQDIFIVDDRPSAKRALR